MWGHLITWLEVLSDLAKAVRWLPVDDPLVLDLDGDGIETVGLIHSAVHFDLDGDFFAERTGWLDGDDGFLAIDRDGDGRIADVAELFGGASGFAALAEFDADGDGAVTAADPGFASLRIWRDRDQDGVADDGELSTLAEAGIAALDAAGRRWRPWRASGGRVRPRPRVGRGAVRQWGLHPPVSPSTHMRSMRATSILA